MSDDSAVNKARLCKPHQRALELDFDGVKRRFCQQCVRVHDLDKFHGNNRGCVARLKRQSIRFVNLSSLFFSPATRMSAFSFPALKRSSTELRLTGGLISQGKAAPGRPEDAQGWGQQDENSGRSCAIAPSIPCLVF